MNNFRALSKLLSRVENREEGFLSDLAKLHSKCRHVPVWGFTGPPGAGKSTLVDQIIRELRKKHLKIAILAIDPSSPFSGGSVLGDRIRMQRHFEDEGVFIRSLGHRGSHGGLSLATQDLIVCLDAHGFDHILIETVGVGQTELGVMEVADSTVVILVPEAGDAVQMLKAGLTEIGDVFVINKADREGAETLQKTLQATLHYAARAISWEVPVLLTQAEKGSGVEGLVDALQKHTEFIRKDKGAQQKKREAQKRRFLELYWEQKRGELEQKLLKDKKFQKQVDEILAGKQNPYETLLKSDI